MYASSTAPRCGCRSRLRPLCRACTSYCGHRSRTSGCPRPGPRSAGCTAGRRSGVPPASEVGRAGRVLRVSRAGATRGNGTRLGRERLAFLGCGRRYVTGKLEKMMALVPAQPQRHGEGVEHLSGDADPSPPLQVRVSGGADPGRQRQFLSAKSGGAGGQSAALCAPRWERCRSRIPSTIFIRRSPV